VLFAFWGIATGNAHGALITLYNTGQGGTPGMSDLHYTLTGGTATILNVGIPLAYVGAASGEWIGPDADGLTDDPLGIYVYTTTFDLTGLISSTASISGQFAADNFGEIYLNGVATGITTDPVNHLMAGMASCRLRHSRSVWALWPASTLWRSAWKMTLVRTQVQSPTPQLCA
jgi:hypothetical protein